MMRKMPIPEIDNTKKKIIEDLVSEYFKIFNPPAHNFLATNQSEEAKKILLAIDAEILRLYNLPPRLEKRLLDFFAGYQRKGVDFEFDRYYPENFEPYIPLHIYISEEFQNSTVENVKKWVEKNRTPEIIEAFKTAVRISKEQ